MIQPQRNKKGGTLLLTTFAKALAVDLTQDGLESTLASEIARWAGNNGVGVVIVPGRVSGTALFDVRNEHGTVRVVLNQEHRLFRVLNVLSDPIERENLEDVEVDGQEMAHLFYCCCVLGHGCLSILLEFRRASNWRT